MPNPFISIMDVSPHLLMPHVGCCALIIVMVNKLNFPYQLLLSPSLFFFFWGGRGVSVQSVQDGVYTLGKVHIRSTPLRSSPKFDFKTATTLELP